MENEATETKNLPSVGRGRRRALAALARLAEKAPVDRRSAQILGVTLIALAHSKDPQALNEAADKFTREAA